MLNGASGQRKTFPITRRRKAIGPDVMSNQARHSLGLSRGRTAVASWHRRVIQSAIATKLTGSPEVRVLLAEKQLAPMFSRGLVRETENFQGGHLAVCLPVYPRRFPRKARETHRAELGPRRTGTVPVATAAALPGELLRADSASVPERRTCTSGSIDRLEASIQIRRSSAA